MSRIVSLFLSSDFLDSRPIMQSRYPLFYHQPSSNEKRNKEWTIEDIKHVDHFYELYLYLQNKRAGFKHILPPAPYIYVQVYKSPRLASLVWACRPGKHITSVLIRASSDSAGNSNLLKGNRYFIPTLISSKTIESHSDILSNGHALIFAPNGVVSCEREYDTELCRRYRGSKGVMWPLNESAPRLTISEDATHIGVCVFFQVIEPRPRVIPLYDVVSRGYVRLDESDHKTLTTFAGPLTSTYNVDMNTLRTIKNFEYGVDCFFVFDSRVNGQETPRETPERAPLRLFDNDEELALNTYLEKMYDGMERVGIFCPQSFVYRGLNALIPITIVAHFEPDEAIDEIHLANSVKRTCARRSLTEDEFCAKLLTNTGNAGEKRQMFIETANLGNTLNYREDLVWGKRVDVHESIRLTNSGDCEDSGEAAFRIIRQLQQFRDGKTKGVRALCDFVRKTDMVAMLVHMRVNYKSSDSHTVAAGVVCARDGLSGRRTMRADRNHQMYFMDATGIEQGNFCMVTKDEREESEWRETMAAMIPKNSILDFYREPCCSESDKKAGDFYEGFLGGVAVGGSVSEPSYFVFSKPGKGINGLSKDGIDVCETVIDSDYELVDLLVEYKKESWFKKAEKTMQKIAKLTPPLPMANDRCDFPAEYKQWLVMFERLAKKGEKKRKKAFTVFVSLSETEEKLEKAAKDLDLLKEFSSSVDVTGFSIFRGNAVIEINFW